MTRGGALLPSPARCAQLRLSLADTGVNTAAAATSAPEEATTDRAGTAGPEQQTAFAGGPGHETTLGGPNFAPLDARAIPDASDQAASLIVDIAQHRYDNEPGRGLGTGHAPAGAGTTAPGVGKVSVAGTGTAGEAQEGFSRAAKQRSVRFEQGAVVDGLASLRPADTRTTQASSVVNEPRQDRFGWKHGKQRRMWKGLSSSSRTPSYGSVEDNSDGECEESGGRHKETGEDPSKMGISRIPRPSFYIDRSGDSSNYGSGGGGAHGDALLRQGDSPTGANVEVAP